MAPGPHEREISGIGERTRFIPFGVTPTIAGIIQDYLDAKPLYLHLSL
jgi:hypothetical protein